MDFIQPASPSGRYCRIWQVIKLVVLNQGVLRISDKNPDAAVELGGNIVNMIIDDSVVSRDVSAFGHRQINISEFQAVAGNVSKDAALYQVCLCTVSQFQSGCA